MNPVYEGGCLCGAVRYAVDAEPRVTALCHCRSCRRASGAPSVAWTVFPTPSLRYTQGEPARHASSAGVRRSFCSRCGTALTYESDERREWIDVTTASLDTPERFVPQKEIHFGERLLWQPHDPALPQFWGSSTGGVPLPLLPIRNWTREFTTDIDAPASAAWRALAAVHEWKHWNTGVLAITLHGEFAAGSRFEMTVPGPETLDSTLLEVTAGESFTDLTMVGETRVLVTHLLQRLAPSRTRVRYRIEVAGADAESIGSAVSADFPDVLASLKRRLESAN